MGRVSRIQGDPALIVAFLVATYEKDFGKRVNFSLSKKPDKRAIIK